VPPARVDGRWRAGISPETHLKSIGCAVQHTRARARKKRRDELPRRRGSAGSLSELLPSGFLRLDRLENSRPQTVALPSESIGEQQWHPESARGARWRPCKGSLAACRMPSGLGPSGPRCLLASGPEARLSLARFLLPPTGSLDPPPRALHRRESRRARGLLFPACSVMVCGSSRVRKRHPRHEPCDRDRLVGRALSRRSTGGSLERRFRPLPSTHPSRRTPCETAGNERLTCRVD
jgi:hypothetical protein